MEEYKQLEKEFAAFTGVEEVVACSSGTAALHLAFEALQLPPRSQVLCPDLTMIACPRAITLTGLTLVFVDCDDRLLMDLDLVDKVLSERSSAWNLPSAILAVHIYGRQLNMDALHMLAEKYGLLVVEDLAEAHGIKPHPKTTAACWSFYANKQIGGEEGGAVAFPQPSHTDYVKRARQLRNLGFTEDHDFTHTPKGCNYRLANLLAKEVLDGPNGLRNYQRNKELRGYITDCYDTHCHVDWRMPRRDANWVYDLRIRGMQKNQQDKIVKALNLEGIAARHCFKAMHEQAEYARCEKHSKEQVTNAFRLSREVIYLPVQPRVTTEESIKRAFVLIQVGLK